jgi:hypothetical protein
MKITRTSVLTGNENTMEVPITEQELEQFDRLKNRKWLLPHLTKIHVNFLLMGVIPAEEGKE